MTQKELQLFFENSKNTYAKELKSINSTINLLATARIIVALALLILVYFVITSSSLILAGLGLLLLIGFIVLVNYHQNYFERKIILDELVNINNNEIQACDYNFDGFPTGKSYEISGHPFTLDLDIFGENSLFQQLNRTCTEIGKTTLAKLLSNPLTDAKSIQNRQLIIKELSEKILFRQEFQAIGNTIEEKSGEITGLLKWFKTPSFFIKSQFIKLIRFISPIALIISFVLSFFNSKFTGVALIIVLFNWLIYFLFAKKVSIIHAQVGSKNGILNKYLKLLNHINKQSFNHPDLAQMQVESTKSVSSMTAFSKIINTLDQRTNLLGIILNSLFLIDLNSVIKLEKWKQQNQQNIEKWLNIIQEFDAFNSMANFTFCHAQFIFPTLSNQLTIESKGLGHPLMNYEDCITNDTTLGKQEKLMILTGANMSGKSTFLRSVGLNTLMSQIGLPVFAEQFDVPVIGIFTSMRVTDSLKEQASYFYAELKRLQSIIKELEKGNPMLIMLDEVLKGTNSDDKLSGSIAITKKFIKFNSLGIIATHDLELGKMEDQFPNQISNYCFESIIQKDSLYFDYKLNEGIAKNKNATFLLKTMDII